MIDLFSRDQSELSAESLRDYLLSEFVEAEWLDANEMDLLCHSLSLSLSEYVRMEALVSDDLCHPMIPLMIARCLWHLGREEAARHLLGHAVSSQVFDKICLYIQSSCALRFPIIQWIQRGVLSPIETSMAHDDLGWQLNLKPFQEEQMVEFELEREALLKTLIQTVTILYDTSKGRGTLYLRRGLTKRNGVSWPEDEVLAFVQECILRAQHTRGWNNIPHVVLLDAASAKAA